MACNKPPLQLECGDFQHTSTLKRAFEQCPGFSEKFVYGLLKQFRLDDHISESELMLRLMVLSNRSDRIHNEQQSAVYDGAEKLKESLVKIPDTIDDRPNFVENIR
ncbi:hypothetical protein D915_001816 [Fasciola hepatica]|uniref:Uncharacterized protein n=1 Tax=Fasciola hepatica TaxID=6192 RepID=A0A4E0REB4_FASHE|nr:hypothetical protein D915_001816 [Fasciola hepatica]